MPFLLVMRRTAPALSVARVLKVYVTFRCGYSDKLRLTFRLLQGAVVTGCANFVID